MKKAKTHVNVRIIFSERAFRYPIGKLLKREGACYRSLAYYYKKRRNAMVPCCCVCRKLNNNDLKFLRKGIFDHNEDLAVM